MQTTMKFSGKHTVQTETDFKLLTKKSIDGFFFWPFFRLYATLPIYITRMTFQFNQLQQIPSHLSVWLKLRFSFSNITILKE